MNDKLNVYSADIKICGTAYIRATSEREARQLLQQTYGKNCSIEIGADDVTISDRPIDSPRLPAISLSGAMTCYGRWGAPLTLAASHVNENWDAD